MKKAVSWIEFLITLGIFTIVVLWIFRSFVTYTNTLSQQFREFTTLQEGLAIASYLLSFSNISSTNYTLVKQFMERGYKNPIFRYKEIPYIIFLSNYSKPTCSSCIMFFYNYTKGCYEIYESSKANLSTYLGIILYSYNFPSVYKINNAQVICYNFLNISIVKLGSVRSFRYCDIILYKDSGVYLCNINNLVIIDHYRSILDFYLGNKYVFKKQGSNFMLPTQTINFFKYENYSIGSVFLSLK